MGEPAMELGNRELEKIGEYVKSHLEEWMQPIRAQRELNLIERVIRVEEELKNLREQETTQFNAIDKRFEDQQHYMEKRFGQVDKQFEQVDKRFEEQRQHMDDRFKSLQWFMGIGFSLMAALIGVIDLL